MTRGIYFLVVFCFLVIGVVSACDSGQVDINSASLGELDKIIWVGPATAQKIVDARPFDSVEELIEVSGIGDVKVAAIVNQDLACVKEDSEEMTEEEAEETKQEEERFEELVVNYELTPPEPVVGDVIVLTPKGIKTEKESFNKEKLAKTGLMTVSLILLGLFAFQFKKKWNQKKLKEL